MAYLVNTPWCVANLVVPDSWDKTTVEKCVTINTGSCPSGITFSWHGFVSDLQSAFGVGWHLAPKGVVAELPWGSVSDCMVVVDSDTWSPID